MRRLILGVLMAVVAWGTSLAAGHETLTVGMSEFPSDMHPLISNLLVRNYLLAVSRRLVIRFDQQGKVLCQLCTEVPSVANGRVKVVDQADGTKGMEVTFTLRPGLVWADGAPLTSKDIVFGYEVGKAFSPPVSTTGVEVVDEQTYRVKLKSLRYDFDRLSPDPFPEHVEGERFRSAKDPLDYGNKSAFNTAPATLGLWNGPYVLTDFKANESVSFARNPRWDGEPPAFDHVVFRFYASTPAMQAALLAGDIDTVYGYTLDQAIELQKTQAQRFEVTFTPALTTTFLYLNTETPQLADKRVRQAILSGIDRATLVKKLYEDKVPVATSFLSPVEADYAADLPHWPYDPKRARDLLAAAGFKPGADGVMVGADGKRLSLELDVSSGIRIVELVQQVIQSQLKAVGIEIVAKTEPVRVLLGETVRKRVFPAMTMFSWTPAPAAVPYFTYHSGRIPSAANNYDGVNYTGFRNARMDTLLTDALAELDGEKRRSMMHEIQAIVMDELPQLPLYQGANVYVQPRWMSGMVPPRSYSVPTPWIEYWKVR